MAGHQSRTAADQNRTGESVAVASKEATGKLRVDIPDNKAPNSTQDTMSGDEKTAVESSKDDSSKGPPPPPPFKGPPPPPPPAIQPPPPPGMGPQPIKSSKSDEEEKAAKEREEWEENRRKLPRKAAVKWSDYEHFKNRYSSDEGLEIIEVLYGHPDLGGEIVQEKTRRNSKRAIASRKAPSADNRWIQRVRIESPVIIPLLAQLTSCDGASDDWPLDRPRVFFRPFQTFYHTFPVMKKCLEALENPGFKEPDPGVTSNTTLAGHTTIIDSFPDTSIEAVVEGLDPTTALAQLRVYVKFVQDEIIKMWDDAAGTKHQRARWCDLPMFFRPGELLFTTHGTSATTPTSKSAAQSKTTEKRASQNIFKFISANASAMEDFEPSDWRNTRRSLMIRAYYVDFDGDRYGPSEALMNIKEYSGEKDIRSLYVYPLRYEKDSERDRIKKDLLERGKRFLRLVRERYCHHDGWSLLFHKFGHDLMIDSHRDAEYIDGEIMIDFKEGGRANPFMVGEVDRIYDLNAFMWDNRTDPIEIKFWDDSSRNKLLGESRDVSQTEEDFDKQHELASLKRDLFLKAHNEEASWLKEYTTDLSSHFNDETYILLPQRVVAYSFRARKFFMADVDCISALTSTKHSFRDLKIDRDHKIMVKSLARSHFEKQDMRRQSTSANLDQDFIRGKGAGLIILLHGVPGVGKTTTAEAVALHNRKPLFTITASDLGFTPNDVERALRETFRLAQLWDCVLLLDEADLFLSRRESHDLKRSALVSVFLRVLEYYNGILFLTTNRVGTIDEGFKSRIHVSLYYPPLDEKQTMDIFKVNLARLHEIEAAKTASWPDHATVEIDDASILDFAIEHFREHIQSQKWNGRQIRNAFQVAYSLAQFNFRNNDPDDSDDEGLAHATQVKGEKTSTYRMRLKLDRSQFKSVSASIERFDRYLFKTRGTDSDAAKTFQLRNDNYHHLREDSRRSLGPDSRSIHRLHARREMAHSPAGQGSIFDARARSPKLPSREILGDEGEEEEEADSDLEGPSAFEGGPDHGRYKNIPVRQRFPTSYSSPAVPKTKRGKDRHYGEMGGDEFSPDDTGYGRGGGMSSGRANSYGRGGYEY